MYVGSLTMYAKPYTGIICETLISMKIFQLDPNSVQIRQLFS